MHPASPILVASLVWLAHAPSAHAQTRPIAHTQSRPIAEALTVLSDDDCLGVDALLDSLRTWSHRDEAPTNVSLLLESADGRGTLTLLVDGRVGAVRRFERLPSSCPDRRAVLGLAAAIALDATVLEELAPVVSASAAAPTVADEPRIATPSAGSALDVVATMAGGVSIGQLPSVTPALSLDLAFVVDRTFAVSFGAQAAGPSQSTLGTGRLEAALVLGRAHACLVRRDATVELAGCAGLSAGAVLARGVGFSDTRSVALPRVAASARLEGTWWLDASFGLALIAEAQAALEDVQLETVGADGQVLARELLPPAALLVGVGARFRLGP